MFNHIWRYIFNSVSDSSDIPFGKRNFFVKTFTDVIFNFKVPILNQTRPNNDGYQIRMQLILFVNEGVWKNWVLLKIDDC